MSFSNLVDLLDLDLTPHSEAEIEHNLWRLEEGFADVVEFDDIDPDEFEQEGKKYCYGGYELDTIYAENPIDFPSEAQIQLDKLANNDINPQFRICVQKPNLLMPTDMLQFYTKFGSGANLFESPENFTMCGPKMFSGFENKWPNNFWRFLHDWVIFAQFEEDGSFAINMNHESRYYQEILFFGPVGYYHVADSFSEFLLQILNGVNQQVDLLRHDAMEYGVNNEHSLINYVDSMLPKNNLSEAIVLYKIQNQWVLLDH